MAEETEKIQDIEDPTPDPSENEPESVSENETESKNSNQNVAEKPNRSRTLNQLSFLNRVRSIGDFFKRKKEGKAFFMKVGIGVGVVLMLIVIIIVVAAVVPKSGGDGDGGTADQVLGGTTTQLSDADKLEFDIHGYYRIQIDQSVTYMLAIDDDKQRHILEVGQNSRTIYYIVDFRERRQLYVGILKEEDPVASVILENTVLFCYSRGLESTFSGEFLSTADMRATGGTSKAEVSGIERTVTASESANPMRLRGSLAKIFNSSCPGLSPDDSFQWLETEQACDGKQATTTAKDPNCRGGPCPIYDESQPLTTNQACKKFRACNYIRGFCDKFWTDQNPYNHLPYCNCRQKLSDDVTEIMCPDPSFDGSECEAPRRRANDMSRNNPCLCQYTIPRIHRYVPRGGESRSRDILWRIDQVTVTGPSPNFENCANC